MAAPASARRNPSLSGSSRLSLSVGKASSTAEKQGRHPLKHEWSLSYISRAPGAKVDYEKETKRMATFGSIESFLHLYSHLTPVNELTPVTDLLVFLSRIPRPGVWEEMRDGGKFTIRLVHQITPVLFESLLFAMIGDQFEESDSVVGCVVSHRNGEDILGVWVEEEGEAVKSGQLREKIISILNLPPGTTCEYRSNKAFIDAASRPHAEGQDSTPARAYNHHHHHHHQQQHQHHNQRGDRDNQHQHHNRHDRNGPQHGRGYRRDEEGNEGREGREVRERPEGRSNGWGR